MTCYGLLLLVAVIGAALLAGVDMPPWGLGLIALALFAATCLPIARWLVLGLDDLVYAQHDDPFAVIGRVDAALRGMPSLQATLPDVARIVARELRLPYVAIETDESDADHAPPRPAVFAHGLPDGHGALRRLPIAYLDQPLGALLAARRSPGRPLSARDVGLLEDVARQLGIALYALRLTRDVRASRERLVAMREEERRRIRNNLHDGLAPTLSSLQLQLGAIALLMREQPDKAEAIVKTLSASVREATADIRRLVHDLRPPMLDELGLVEAVRHQHDALVVAGDVALEVEAPEPLPMLSAAVEVAAFRIASEAIENVIRHAGATRCTVRFDVVGDLLRLAVSDDGVGLPAAPRAGVGSASMRERAAELGGTLTMDSLPERGARVVAMLPLARQRGPEEREPSTR